MQALLHASNVIPLKCALGTPQVAPVLAPFPLSPAVKMNMSSKEYFAHVLSSGAAIKSSPLSEQSEALNVSHRCCSDFAF